MAPNILRGRKNGYVYSVINRFNQSDANSIINNKRDTGIVGNLRNGLKIRHIQFRIANGFSIDCSCPLRNRLLEFFGLCGFNKLHISP